MSTLLCNYFYGNLERELLSHAAFEGSGTLLLRMVDDFLLLTVNPDGMCVAAARRLPCKKRKKNRGAHVCSCTTPARLPLPAALAFLNIMRAGVEEYGCEINQGKTQLNFDPEQLDCLTSAAASGACSTASMTPAASATLATQGVLSLASVGWKRGEATGALTAPHEEDAEASGDWLQWCGYLLHTARLQLRNDFNRLCGVHIGDSMTLHWLVRGPKREPLIHCCCCCSSAAIISGGCLSSFLL